MTRWKKAFGIEKAGRLEVPPQSDRKPISFRRKIIDFRRNLGLYKGSSLTSGPSLLNWSSHNGVCKRNSEGYKSETVKKE